MIKGKCPNCGQFYFGWALMQPRKQICAECNAKLVFTQEEQKAIENYSLFNEKKYQLPLLDKDILEREL